MKSTKEYLDYVLNDVLPQLDGLTAKPMFGGFGIWKDGIFIAYIHEDQLYFKVDEEIKKEFEEMGSQPFIYSPETETDPEKIFYWSVPEEIMDDPEKVKAWALKSFEIAKKKRK